MRQRFEAAGHFYDTFAKKMNKSFGMNMFTVLVWVGKDGKPAYDFRSTPGWSFSGDVQEIESMFTGMVADQFRPGGGSLLYLLIHCH